MRRYLIVAAAASLTLFPLFGGGSSATARGIGAIRVNHSQPTQGVLGEPPTAAHVRVHPAGVHAASAPTPSVNSGGCSDTSATNVRVNQDCTNHSEAGLYGRGEAQNETAVAVNPTDSSNVIASQNDYRRGDANCGVDFSTDGGQHWGSQTAPMSFITPGFVAPRHYWDAGGDTSVAFDSTGEAYLMCQVFDRGGTSDANSNASAFLLFRSGDGGASWSFDADPVVQSDGTGIDGIGLLDKEYMTIDNNPSSPNKDRIYVTWTQYNTAFTAAPIYLAYSDDHGVTWHNSGNVIPNLYPSLCPINFSGSAPGTCDNNQFSDPFVAPNGDVFVTFDNYNNCAGAIGPPCSGSSSDNHNQVLLVESTNGGSSFLPPVKVSSFWDLPDCYTYTAQDFGRACVPTAPLSAVSIFRAANYPSGVAVSNSTIVVNFGSYLNPHSNPILGNCSPNGFNSSTGLNKYNGVGNVNGCNNDIIRATSSDGGASFNTASRAPQNLPVMNDEGATLADQWFQWTALNPVSGKVGVAYYDRKYGSDQSNGDMDITLATAATHTRVTDSSMPESIDFPAGNGYSTFMGDYNALAYGSDGVAHPVWTDNRNPLLAWSTSGDARTLTPVGYDEDIYTRSL